MSKLPDDAHSVAGSGTRAILALVGVQLLFGVWPVVGKYAIGAFGADGLAVMRIGGAAVAFHVVARLADAPAVPWREHPRLALLAVLGISANQLLYIHGLSHTSVTHAAILTTTIPVQTLLVALLLGRETFLPRRAMGIVVALAGAVLLVAAREPAGTATLHGDLLILANTAVYAAYLVLSRDVLARLPPLSVLPWLFTWGLLTALPFAGLPDVTGHPPAAWAAIAFVILGPTVGTYWLNLFALRTVPSSVVAVFIYLQPVVATGLAIPILGERPTVWTVVSALITFAGMALTTAPSLRPWKKDRGSVASEG